MTHQPSPPRATGTTASGQQVARLRHVLALVEEIAGGTPSEPYGALDADARTSSAYESAPPIVRRSFDALAGETAAWAAAGVKALLRHPVNPPRPAARLLAQDLRKALKRLSALLA